MRVSVVISTLNRPESLARTLTALRYQRHREFEVILVEGPSEPGREAALAGYGPEVRLVRCPVTNVARSRNLGVAAASGEVVAFTDDDAIPAPDWLERLVEAFDEPGVVGAGGIVFDSTGCRLEYEYLTCDRLGHPSFDSSPSPQGATAPGADPFLYLSGNNMSFRREALVEVGGFDEEFDYLYDEVEACVALIDRGARLRQLPGAAVVHLSLASQVRGGHGLWRDPFCVMKNRVYFGLRYGAETHSTEDVMASANAHAGELRVRAEAAHARGRFSEDERRFFLERLEQGMEAGRERARPAVRRGVTLPPADSAQFRRYPVLHDGPAPLRICLISPEDPTEDIGGIGRQASETATALASRGHEAHVLTSTRQESQVVFDDGVWWHHVAVTDRRIPGLDGLELSIDLYAAAAKYHEVVRLHERAPVDLVVAPLWRAEGLICLLDGRFAAATRLVTPAKTIAAMHQSFAASPRIRELIRLEAAALRFSRHVLAASRAIVEEVQSGYGPLHASVELVPLGIADRVHQDSSPANGAGRDGATAARTPTAARAGGEGTWRPSGQEPVEVLFVGRLERRKGVDVLLEAARRLVPEYPYLSFTLAGPDTPNTELGETYREAFWRQTSDRADLRERVRFAGAVDDDELWELYRRADIFCAPSRYESFGNVLIEAMMSGKPIVACRAGGMPEVIEEGSCGYLADPGDVPSLIACLRPLVEDARLRDEFGSRSRAIYETRYALDTVADALVAAYRRIIAEQAPRAHGHPDVARPLAQPLAGLLGLGEDEAHSLALRLLAGSSYPVDYLTRIGVLSDAPAREFVDGVYRTVLGHEPDPEGEAAWLRYLLADGDRLTMVAAMARSDEARRRGVPTAWLEGLAAERHRDLLERVQALMALSDEAFVRGLFKEVFGRLPDDEAARAYVEELGRGTSRVTIVRLVVDSDEARERYVPTGWIDELAASSEVPGSFGS